MSEVGEVLAALKGTTLPASLALLKAISSLDWDCVAEEDFDQCMEIVLRVTASAIVCIDTVGHARAAYKDAFNAITHSVHDSGLPDRSAEFREYFDKYRLRVSELG